MNNYYIVIIVEASEGEETTRITEITVSELEVLWPLLCYIRDSYGGYFSTGKYRKGKDPTPEELYSMYPGWKELITRFPEPKSGVKRISEIHIFSETPKSLYM